MFQGVSSYFLLFLGIFFVIFLAFSIPPKSKKRFAKMNWVRIAKIQGSDSYNYAMPLIHTHTRVLCDLGVLEDPGVNPVGSGRVPFNPRI